MLFTRGSRRAGELKAARPRSENLHAAFHPYEVGLVHGQMDSEESARAIKPFATAISPFWSPLPSSKSESMSPTLRSCSSNAERFGLAQLHRCGHALAHGARQSHCILLTIDKERKSELTKSWPTPMASKLPKPICAARSAISWERSKRHSKLRFSDLVRDLRKPYRTSAFSGGFVWLKRFHKGPAAVKPLLSLHKKCANNRAGLIRVIAVRQNASMISRLSAVNHAHCKRCRVPARHAARSALLRRDTCRERRPFSGNKHFHRAITSVPRCPHCHFHAIIHSHRFISTSSCPPDLAMRLRRESLLQMDRLQQIEIILVFPRAKSAHRPNARLPFAIVA